MAKRRAAAADWLLIAGVIGVLIILIGIPVAIKYFKKTEVVVAGSEPCLPRSVEQVRMNTTAAVRNPGNIKVYFDASGGMAGYVAQAPNVIGNLSSLVGNFAQSSLYAAGKPGKVGFYRFGQYRYDDKRPSTPDPVTTPSDFAKGTAFSEPVSNIADVLRWVQHDRRPDARPGDRTLSIIVTDLMLDDREATDDFEASVGGVLRKMVSENGLAVGLLSVRVPFSGKIFIGDRTLQARLADRPLVILMIGDPYQVRSFFEYLETSEIAPFSANTSAASREFTLFGHQPGSIVLASANMSGVSTGFSARPARIRIPGAEKIQSFTFSEDAVRAGSKGGLAVTLQANADVKDYEVLGNQPRWESTVWKLASGGADRKTCKSGEAWINAGALPASGWKAAGQTLTYQLDAAAMKRARMDQKGVYLVQLIAGQEGIVADHPATAWMAEWSTSNAELSQRLSSSVSATRTGVPGLAQLRSILLTEQRMPGRQALVRTADHFIIQSE